MITSWNIAQRIGAAIVQNAQSARAKMQTTTAEATAVRKRKGKKKEND